MICSTTSLPFSNFSHNVREGHFNTTWSPSTPINSHEFIKPHVGTLRDFTSARIDDQFCLN
jgi:hypothetical protein